MVLVPRVWEVQLVVVVHSFQVVPILEANQIWLEDQFELQAFLLEELEQAAL